MRLTSLAARAATGPAIAAACWSVPAVSVLGTFSTRPRQLLGARLRGPDRREVALTFDDGPSESTTRSILEELDRLKLVATFFVLGEAVRDYPALVEAIANQGHEIALHGDSHRHHLLSSPRQLRTDLAAGMSTLLEMGIKPAFYRPPYGQVALGTLVAAREMGLRIVLWNSWGREFADTDEESIVARLTRQLGPGSILLLHDSDRHSTSGTAQRAKGALEALAGRLCELELQAVRVSDLLSPVRAFETVSRPQPPRGAETRVSTGSPTSR